MDSSWDDAALLTAFNSAMGKYQDRHNPKKQQPQAPQQADGSASKSTAMHEDQAPSAGANAESSQQADYSSWPGGEYQYSYPFYPFPQSHQAPYPSALPMPMFCPVFPMPTSHCCHQSCQCSLKAEFPSFETLKQAVLQSLSQLPPDKRIALEDNAEVLIAWFNAGFRTASSLYKKS